MNTDNDRKSSFKLIWLCITFTDEPPRYRLTVVIIGVVAMITIVFIMREYSILAVAHHVAANKVSGIKEWIKRRLP